LVQQQKEAQEKALHSLVKNTSDFSSIFIRLSSTREQDRSEIWNEFVVYDVMEDYKD